MRLTFAFAIWAACVIAPLSAIAEEGNSANETPAPKIGEIMVLQQMRHIKLWFAGRDGNWPLADYEIDQLKDGFDDLNRVLGGDTVEKAVGGPLAAIEKAVEVKDRAAFVRAYDALSAGCNSCHRTLDHGFIVIRRPVALPYSDQAFEPQK